MSKDAPGRPAKASREDETGVAWDGLTLGQALQRCVQRWGDRELLVFPERRLNAREFEAETQRMARGLLKLGVERGDHVAAWLPNCAELCALEFAVARVGAALVAFNTRYRASELTYVIEQSDATALFTMPRCGKLDLLATLKEVLPELASDPPGEAPYRAAPRLKRVISVGEGLPGMLTYEELLRLGDNPVGQDKLQQREVETRPDDVVLLQYTSGTTRFPKAAMLTHGAVLRNAAQMAARAGIGENDRVLSAMPMFHVGGSVCALLGTVTAGARLYLSAVFDSGETLRTIQEEHITTYIGLESMFLALQAHPDFSRYSRASLKKGWTAGTSALLRMVAEEIGIEGICSLYGLSEASPNVCICDWRDPVEKRMTTMGRPQPGTEVKIVFPDTGKVLRPGQVGEICVRGYSVMKGYYKDPEATACALDPDGWLHTGDLGKVDEEGFLTWTGRLKDVVRVGGENISAVEVEDLVSSHPAVQAAVVVGVPDERLGEVPFAFVQRRAREDLSEQELIEYCRTRVSGFKVPRYVHFVESFPMTGSGKIQKFLVKDRAVALARQRR